MNKPISTPSVSSHSEDCSNIPKFLSALTFLDPGVWAAEIHSYRSVADCHMLKAISSHSSIFPNFFVKSQLLLLILLLAEGLQRLI